MSKYTLTNKQIPKQYAKDLTLPLSRISDVSIDTSSNGTHSGRKSKEREILEESLSAEEIEGLMEMAKSPRRPRKLLDEVEVKIKEECEGRKSRRPSDDPPSEKKMYNLDDLLTLEEESSHHYQPHKSRFVKLQQTNEQSDTQPMEEDEQYHTHSRSGSNSSRQKKSFSSKKEGIKETDNTSQKTTKRESSTKHVAQHPSYLSKKEISTEQNQKEKKEPKAPQHIAKKPPHLLAKEETMKKIKNVSRKSLRPGSKRRSIAHHKHD
ncbi:hypothetical protein QTN25_000469 [Entamoeba marina]